MSAGGVGGFYSPSEERIVVVSENTTTPRLNEIVLAQELMHALQFDFAENRSFGLTDEYEAAFGTGRMTTDRHNAYDAVIEGDGNYVDYIYRQRCDGSWDCLTVEQAGGAGAVYDAGEWGAILTQYAPYSDGPSFVREVYREGGWEAVNALYRNPVQSTEQLVHPERYPDDAPRAVALDDRSGGAWERLVPPANGSLGGLPGMNASHDTFGEAGMVSMFVAPGFPGGTETVFRRGAFLTGDDFDPYDYRFEATTGWDGDRIEVYVTDDSAATNETGYVWRSVWDSSADAAAFADAYRELLSVRNARPVAGAEDVYVVLDAGREPSFADAFALRVENDTVAVVNAPTLDALNGVRAGTVPDGLTRPTPTPTPTPYDFSTATVTPTATGTGTGTETAEATATATETPGQPGFGALAVVTALAALVGLFGRRRA
ncbi:Hvo_1808 family surface protein [Halosegnis marinus]|uniref:Hvo_1808 family surface protein n=1 Tax=Halosegnis marinus TaxID=3034023 RepID=UPI00360AAEA0